MFKDNNTILKVIGIGNSSFTVIVIPYRKKWMLNDVLRKTKIDVPWSDRVLGGVFATGVFV